MRRRRQLLLFLASLVSMLAIFYPAWAPAADVTFDCGYWGGSAVFYNPGNDVAVGTLNGRPFGVYPGSPTVLHQCVGEYTFTSTATDVQVWASPSDWSKRFWMAGAGLASALVLGAALFTAFR